MIQLAAFLGNPGRQYAQTRHNVGWMVLERLIGSVSPAWQTKFKGEYMRYTVPGAGHTVWLLRPSIYMNKSGESVQAAAAFFKLEPRELLVVHDDLESAFGTVTHKQGGGLGGHNGLKSVAQSLGSREFHRLKIGISRPPRGSVSSYVLSRFDESEEAELPEILDTAVSELLGLLGE
jgi:peptidyl-tRNA hydrolase, PTH1 family